MAYKFTEKDIKFTGHFIDGEFRDSKSGKFYELYDLLNNKTLVKVTDGDKDDVDLAVDAALKAFEKEREWRKMDYVQRGKLLFRLADLLEKDTDYLVWLETRNTGKTLDDTTFDLKRSIEFLRYYAGKTDKFLVRTDRDMADDDFKFTRKVARGVIGLVGDHVDPLWTFIRLITPILKAGNTVVYKPSSKTPLTSLYIVHLMDKVGLPKGVVNIVIGKGTVIGETIGLNERIKHVTFTGKREVGKLFHEYSGRSNLKTLKLYLTKISPLVVLKDTDIDDATKIAHHAAFFKDGKTRYRPLRVFVHDDIYDEFVKRSVDLAKRRKLGDILDKDVRVGSFKTEKYYNDFMDLIDRVKKDGAKVEIGGKRFGTTGWIVEPTIISDVKTEFTTDFDVYGPIKLITRIKKFEDIPEILRKVKDRGDTIGVITKEFKRIKELERVLDTKLLWFNTWHDLKPYLKYKESRERDFGVYFDQEYFDRDDIDLYLKKKTIDGLWDTRDIHTHY